MERVVLFRGPGRPFESASFAAPDVRGAEILVRVACCTICGSDLHTHAGRRSAHTPMVLGHEIVGRIEAFGPAACPRDFRGEALTIGDRVSWSIAASCGSCYYCANQLPQKCTMLFKYGHQPFDPAYPFTGGLADVIMLMPGSAIFRVPESLSNAVGASANCATATASAVLRPSGDLAGRSVLIFGAGLLGLTACAMARSAGASSVIVSDADPARRERARQFGATHVTSGEAQQRAADIAEITEGRGADPVLELAGVADTVNAGLALTRIGGTLILAGTVLPTPSIALDPEAVVRRMLTIRGVHNYAPRDLGAALDFLAGPGKGYPFAELVSRTFSLSDIEQAFQHAHHQSGWRVAVEP